MAVLAMYYAVSHWNGYFSAMLYLAGKQDLHPLALYVRQVVIQNSVSSVGGEESAAETTTEQLLSALQIKYAVVVVAVVPMLLIYPLLSKNLEKGLMIGAVKA